MPRGVYDRSKMAKKGSAKTETAAPAKRKWTRKATAATGNVAKLDAQKMEAVESMKEMHPSAIIKRVHFGTELEALRELALLRQQLTGTTNADRLDILISKTLDRVDAAMTPKTDDQPTNVAPVQETKAQHHKTAHAPHVQQSAPVAAPVPQAPQQAQQVAAIPFNPPFPQPQLPQAQQ